MQPIRQRIRACVDMFRLRMDFGGVHPWLWLKAWEIPAQPARGNQRHSPLCTSCFLLLNSFQVMMTVQVNSCSGSSAIQRRRLFCCVQSQHKDNSVSVTSFISACIQKWKRPRPIKTILYQKKKKKKADFISWVKINVVAWWCPCRDSEITDDMFLFLGMFKFDLVLLPSL